MREGRVWRRPGPAGRDGQAMVEFALALPLLMALVFAIVQLAIVVNAQQTLTYAATATALVGRERNRSSQMTETAKQYIGPMVQRYEVVSEENPCPPGGPGQVVLCIYEGLAYQSPCPSPEGPGQMSLCIAQAAAVGTPLKVTIRYNAPLLVSLFGFGGVQVWAEGVAYWGA